MIIFDAILAVIILKFFSESVVLALGVTCLITFLRTATIVHEITKLFYELIKEFDLEIKRGGKVI